jgi:large subunit ribosomal protein L6
MKSEFTHTVTAPEGVTCHLAHKELHCSKGGVAIKKSVSLPGVTVSLSGQIITFVTKKANRHDRAAVKALGSHIENMFAGLKEPFVYEMEVCNVHFPMTVKVEGKSFVITNFLGEKQKRVATILPEVAVEVKGSKVIVSSADKEKAGQTAANIETATKIAKRDRRVFQDGIFITSKCGRSI